VYREECIIMFNSLTFNISLDRLDFQPFRAFRGFSSRGQQALLAAERARQGEGASDLP